MYTCVPHPETCKISCMKWVASSGSMHDTGCLGLVHWDDPEGWYGEGGGRRVQDGIGIKTDLFQSCGHCWVFQIFWHIECSTFTASSFRIWNSSTGILSPPLALFVVMLSKVHLTSHSRMSGSRWVITPSWLSWSWGSFFYSSPVYSCHLFLISSASVRSIQFLFFIEPIFAWNVPLVALIFLKRSLVFLTLLFSSISLHWSLKKAFLSLLAILWNSAFRCLYLFFSLLLFASLLFTAILKASPVQITNWIRAGIFLRH